MAMELCYTSVPRGLFPGSTGFSTVGVTAGMPVTMVQKLESLGGYRLTFPVGDPQEHLNPAVYAHWRASIGGHYYSILSHICYVGADHQGRFNKFAHHVVVETPEQVPPGPAWVMMQPGVMEKTWTGDPRHIPAPRAIPNGANPLRVCEAWRALTGDAGWAGMLAQAFVLDATKPACVLYKPGTEILPLVNEALLLLPEKTRWRVTFNTYFDSLPAGLQCSWRFYAAGSPAAKNAAANATGGVFIDLTRPMGKAPDNYYVAMARAGQIPAQGDAAAGTKLVAGAARVPSQFDVPAFQDAGPYALAEEPVVVPAAAVEENVSTLSRGESVVTVRRPGFLARHGTFFVLAMVLWPLLVLGAGAFVVSQMLPRQMLPVAQDDKVNALQKELDSAKNYATKIEEQRNEYKNKYDATSRDNEEKNSQIARLQNRVDELQQQQVASIDTGKNRPTVLTPTITENNSITSRISTTHTPIGGESAGIKDIHGIKVLPFPEFLVKKGLLGVSPEEKEYDLAKVADADGISVTYPTKSDASPILKAGDGVLRIETPNGASRITWTIDSGLGKQVELLNGVIFIEGGALKYKWTITSSSKERIKSKSDAAQLVQDYLRYAILNVKMRDGKLQTFQFVEPLEVVASPGGDDKPLPFPWRLNPEMVFISDRSSWLKEGSPQVKSNTADCESKNGTIIRVAMEDGGDKNGKKTIFQCKWKKAESVESLQNEINTNIRKIQDDGDNIKNLKKAIADQEKAKDVQKFLDSTRKLADMLKEHREMEGKFREMEGKFPKKKGKDGKHEFVDWEKVPQEVKDKYESYKDKYESLGKGIGGLTKDKNAMEKELKKPNEYLDVKKQLESKETQKTELEKKNEGLQKKQKDLRTFDFVFHIVAKESKAVLAVVAVKKGAGS